MASRCVNQWSWTVRGVGVMLCVACAGAQTQAPVGQWPGGYTLQVNAQRVIEDVVVTDVHGNPVHGLKCEAFTLKEDGKPQRILSFDVHDGTKPEFVPPKVPPLPPNTYVDLPSAPEQGPLYVILYDMVNMSLNGQVYARKGLLKFIDSKPPGTRFAIFLNSDRTSLIQGFTQDKNLLHAALTSTGPGPHLPNQFLYGDNYGQGDEETSMSLFTQLALYLKGVRGRKNLIWLADNFPLDLFPDPQSPISEEEVKEVIAELTRSQVAVYPVDVAGVQGGFGAALARLADDALADATGGKAVYSDNDIADELDKATDAGLSYYTLSYSPTNQKDDREERKIEVKVEGKGYHLAYRPFYYLVDKSGVKAPKPGSLEAYQAATRKNDSLYMSIGHGMPMLHDLIFSTHVRTEGKPAFATQQQMEQLITEPAYFRTRRRNKSLQLPPAMKLETYVIDYQVIDAQLKSAAIRAGKQPTLEFAVAAYDAEGQMVNGVLNDANAAAPKAGEKAEPLFRVEQEIELPLETAWLRIAVRDPMTDRTGTVEIALPLKPEPRAQASSGGGAK